MLALLAALAFADDRAAFEAWLAEQPLVVPATGLADGYRLQREVFAQVAARVDEFPGRVRVEAIGRSHDGHPIWAFHVTDHPEPVAREVLVFAGIHALEWISTETATTLLLDLVAHPVAGTRVTVVPLLNPDGRVRVEQDLVDGESRYRRGNGRGVDLNRDWAVHREARGPWKAIIPGYYATSPAPLSQPETRALDALAARECYARAASLHAFGGFLYFPWSGRWERPEHHEEFMILGRAMEGAQGHRAYKTRQLSRWGFFFRAQGSEIDHLYGRYGTRAWLVELTRSGLQPLRPSTFGQYFRWYNPFDPEPHVDQGIEAMQALIRHPALPGENRLGMCRAVTGA